MHYVIGLITALAGLLFALSRLQRAGLDLNALNPFLWYRRAQWRKKYAAKPIYALDDPMDVAAVLLLEVARCEGAISSEQKREIVTIFEHEFHLCVDEASDLLRASTHLIRDEVNLADNIDKILQRSTANFTAAQVQSLIAMMHHLAMLEGPKNDAQRRLIEVTRMHFANKLKTNKSAWH